MPFVPPILENVVMDPSKFGGPATFRGLVQRNHYVKRYQDYLRKNKTIVMNIYYDKDDQQEKEVFYHFQFPSDANPQVIYDVVLRFYAPNSVVREEETLRNYKIQIFSNSPGFTFQFAYAYNKRKLLIEDLRNKFSPNVLEKEPQKTNPNNAIGYDYTVFFALYHLHINQDYLKKAAIAAYAGDIDKFEMDEIPTAATVYQRRSQKQLIDFDRIKKKAERFGDKVQKKIEKIVTPFLPGTNRSNHQRKHGALNGNGGTKARKGTTTTKAQKASKAVRKHGYFKQRLAYILYFQDKEEFQKKTLEVMTWRRKNPQIYYLSKKE